MNEKDIQENSVSSDVPVSDKMSYCNGRFVKMAGFLSRVETLLMVAGFLFGFVFFVIPTIHEGVRQVLYEWSLLYAVFDTATRLKSAFVYPLLLVMFYVAFVAQMAMSKGFISGWDMRQEGRVPTAKEVMNRSLFPNSKKESVIFLLWFFGKISSIFWWPLLLAAFSSFIRIGA